MKSDPTKKEKLMMLAEKANRSSKTRPGLLFRMTAPFLEKGVAVTRTRTKELVAIARKLTRNQAR